MIEKPVEEQLATFKATFEAFLNIVDTYPETLHNQTGVTGDWSAREVIAHINGWMVEALRRLPRFAKGTGHADYNVDAYNEVSLWLRQDKDYVQLVEEMRTLKDEIIIFITNLDDFYKNRDDRYSTWLRILAEQADQHGKDLNRFMTHTQS